MPRWLRWIAAWSGVWVFWLVVTRNAHPTIAHALVVTTSLVVAYAVASALNQFVFIPRHWTTSRAVYWMWLLGTMLVLTGVALAIIRAAYFAWSGPDADPFGVLT